MCNNLTCEISSPGDHLRGVRDAKDGKPSEIGASDRYMRGFSSQYEAEQRLTAMGLTQDKEMSIFG